MFCEAVPLRQEKPCIKAKNLQVDLSFVGRSLTASRFWWDFRHPKILHLRLRVLQLCCLGDLKSASKHKRAVWSYSHEMRSSRTRSRVSGENSALCRCFSRLVFFFFFCLIFTWTQNTTKLDVGVRTMLWLHADSMLVNWREYWQNQSNLFLCLSEQDGLMRELNDCWKYLSPIWRKHTVPESELNATLARVWLSGPHPAKTQLAWGVKLFDAAAEAVLVVYFVLSVLFATFLLEFFTFCVQLCVFKVVQTKGECFGRRLPLRHCAWFQYLQPKLFPLCSSPAGKLKSLEGYTGL